MKTFEILISNTEYTKVRLEANTAEEAGNLASDLMSTDSTLFEWENLEWTIDRVEEITPQGFPILTTK